MNIRYSCEELREIEREVAGLFEGGKIKGPVHLSGGNEEPLICLFNRVAERDWVLSTHRWHYHYLLKGGTREGLLKHLTTNQPIHCFSKELNFMTSAIVGGMIPIACGIAAGITRRREEGRVWCFIGDGACDSGLFHGAVRYAYWFHLPVRFVVEDNGMSCDSSIAQRFGNCGMECRDDVMFGGMYDDYVEYYEYMRIWPHVGTGRHVAF